MTIKPVKKRAVFLIGGYCRNPAAKFHAFLTRQLAKYATCWGLEVDLSEHEVSTDGRLSKARILTRGQHWTVETDFTFCVWEALVLQDLAHPLWARLANYAMTLFDYVSTGTLWRIFAANWRMGLYFLFPLLTFTLLATLAALVGSAVAELAVPGATALAIVTFIVVLWGLFQLLGERWHVTHLMDLWTFSKQYTHGLRPDATELVDRYARAVIDAVSSGVYDEVLIVGHSSGSILALDTAARASAIDPKLGEHGPGVRVLTIGSTALKVALHPAGGNFRSRLQSLAEAPGIGWIEYQAMTDVINFYKTDPAALLELPQHKDTRFPTVVRVHIKDMLQPVTYRRTKRNLFRVHYQFIKGNDRRYHYDFGMICCGPASLPDRARLHPFGPAGDEAWPT